MSHGISTLLIRNLHDVFGENDPALRRAAIDEIFAEDGVFYEPKGVHRGRDEIDRVAGAIKATHPDFRYQPIAETMNWGWRPGTWVAGRPGERQLTPGLISSLRGTAGLPPCISFSTSYPELNSAVMKTLTRRINVERVTISSRKSLQDVLAKLDAAVGHPNIEEFWKHVAATKTNSEMEKVVQSALGQSGLMEFARFDHGGVVHKGETGDHPKVFRLVIGNPLIMREMVKHVPDAGSYAPITILIDERPDGVHLSYDRMASFLALMRTQRLLKSRVNWMQRLRRCLPQQRPNECSTKIPNNRKRQIWQPNQVLYSLTDFGRMVRASVN